MPATSLTIVCFFCCEPRKPCVEPPAGPDCSLCGPCTKRAGWLAGNFPAGIATSANAAGVSRLTCEVLSTVKTLCFANTADCQWIASVDLLQTPSRFLVAVLATTLTATTLALFVRDANGNGVILAAYTGPPLAPNCIFPRTRSLQKSFDAGICTGLPDTLALTSPCCATGPQPCDGSACGLRDFTAYELLGDDLQASFTSVVGCTGGFGDAPAVPGYLDGVVLDLKVLQRCPDALSPLWGGAAPVPGSGDPVAYTNFAWGPLGPCQLQGSIYVSGNALPAPSPGVVGNSTCIILPNGFGDGQCGVCGYSSRIIACDPFHAQHVLRFGLGPEGQNPWYLVDITKP